MYVQMCSFGFSSRSLTISCIYYKLSLGLKGFKLQFLAIPMLNDEEIDNKITDIKILKLFYTEVSGLNLKFKYVVNLNSNAIYNT